MKNLIFLLLLQHGIAFAQMPDSTLRKAETEGCILFPEPRPQFPGGEKALLKFISDSLRYPIHAKENNIAGKVYATFVVEKDGRLTGVRILRGIGYGCDEEAVRLIQGMPKWISAKTYDDLHTPVRVQYTLRIAFKL
jgi:periplasmic protein TonB